MAREDRETLPDVHERMAGEKTAGCAGGPDCACYLAGRAEGEQHDGDCWWKRSYDELLQTMTDLRAENARLRETVDGYRNATYADLLHCKDKLAAAEEVEQALGRMTTLASNLQNRAIAAEQREKRLRERGKKFVDLLEEGGAAGEYLRAKDLFRAALAEGEGK